MPCTAPVRGKTDTLIEWSDWTDNDPCGKEVYASNLCRLHWQQANGSIVPEDSRTVFLLHGDALGDKYGHPATALSGATVDATQSKFGGSSIKFDGSQQGFLYFADSPDWYFGAGDFTIDFWIRFNTVVADTTIMGQWPNGTNDAWFVAVGGNLGLRFTWSATGTGITGGLSPAWTPVVNTWYHVAVVRSGTNLRLYVNGTEIGNFIPMTEPIADSSNVFSLGGQYPYPFSTLNGWLDEVRISKAARWTSNFAVPTAPYT